MTAGSKKRFLRWSFSVIVFLGLSIGGIVWELSFGWLGFLLSVALMLVVPFAANPQSRHPRWLHIVVIVLAGFSIGVADRAWKQPESTEELVLAFVLLAVLGTGGLLFGIVGLFGLSGNRHRGETG